jgi:hypothetical protein
MNNLTDPLEKTGLEWLEKLAQEVEIVPVGGSEALMPASPLPDVLDRGSAGITPERSRVQFKFWLDILKDEQFELSMEMMLLKKRRKFTTTIRDAMRLILDLRAGRIDVLLELFPFVRDAIAREIMR